jgi:hypothetical protein
MLLVILLFMIGLSVGMPDKRVIQASEVETKIRAGEPAEFDNCTILGDLNLSALTIQWPVHFNHTVFQNSLSFEYTIFNGTAYFEYSVFNGYANFWESAFNGDANFRSSTFNGEANFGGSTFNGTAYFRFSAFNDTASFWGSAFNGEANFGKSIFNGTAYFRSSTFNGEAYFGESAFNGTAYFENSVFNGYANFWESAFNGDANFWGSAFNGEAYFGESAFKKEVFFYDVTFKKKLDLTLTKYSKLYIRWDKNNDLVYDDTAYQLLIENLRKLGFMADADNCYYQFRVDQFLNLNPIEDPLIYIFNFGAWIFYGYGKRPIYPFLWSIFSIGLFAVFWIAVGLQNPKDVVNKFRLDNRWPHRISSSFSLLLVKLIKIIWNAIELDKTIRAIDEYDHVRNWPSSLREAISFSATVFLSGTKFFVDPPVVPVLPGRSQSLIKRAFLFERLLGAFFSILLFLAIGATVVR